MALMSKQERTEKAIKLLRAAAGYVRKGWTREANARKTSGWVCDPESVLASCWCAQGAMLASMPDIGLRHPYLDTTRTYTEAEAGPHHRDAGGCADRYEERDVRGGRYPVRPGGAQERDPAVER